MSKTDSRGVLQEDGRTLFMDKDGNARIIDTRVMDKAGIMPCEIIKLHGENTDRFREGVEQEDGRTLIRTVDGNARIVDRRKKLHLGPNYEDELGQIIKLHEDETTDSNDPSNSKHVRTRTTVFGYCVLGMRNGSPIIHTQCASFEKAEEMLNLMEKEYDPDDENHNIENPCIQPTPRFIRKDGAVETSVLMTESFIPPKQPGFEYSKSTNTYVRKNKQRSDEPQVKKHKKDANKN